MENQNPLQDFINSLQYDVIVSVERRSIIDLSLAIVIVTVLLVLFIRLTK